MPEELTVLLTAAGLVLVLIALVRTLANQPGCSGDCQQGRRPCNCRGE